MTSNGISRSADFATPESIVYLTDGHGDSHATIPGNPHELVWHPDATDPARGDVTLDDHARPICRRFDERAFHSFAESYFAVRHETPPSLLAWIEREKAATS